jgi:hypothetical protein
MPLIISHLIDFHQLPLKMRLSDDTECAKSQLSVSMTAWTNKKGLLERGFCPWCTFSRRHYLKVRGKTQAKANISNHAFSMSRMYSTCLDESQTFTHLKATRTLNWPLIRSRFEVAKAEYRPFIHIAFFSTNQPKFSRTFAPIRHGRSDAFIQPSHEAQRGPHGFRCGARR